MEITMHNLQANGDIDLRDFLARADMLAACGKTVLISDYFEYYRLAAYLARYTKQKIGITMGAGSLCDLFDEKYYTQLDGGILESFGRLFKNDLKLYIYPLQDRKTGELTTVENLRVPPSCGSCSSISSRRVASSSCTTTTLRACRSFRATCCSRSKPAIRRG